MRECGDGGGGGGDSGGGDDSGDVSDDDGYSVSCSTIYPKKTVIKRFIYIEKRPRTNKIRASESQWPG